MAPTLPKMKNEKYTIENDLPPLPDQVHEIVERTFSRYPLLAGSWEGLVRTYHAIVSVFEQHGILYLCGNGGSLNEPPYR